VLRRIYGPYYNTFTQQHEIRHNEDLRSLFKHSNVATFVKTKRIQWLGHVWRAERSEMKEILYKKLNRKIPRGRPRQRWLDTVLKDLRTIDDTIQVGNAGDRERYGGRQHWPSMGRKLMKKKRRIDTRTTIAYLH